MKKLCKFGMYLSGALSIAGIIASARTYFENNTESKTITIIGGADGPTSIYMAGTISGWDVSVVLYSLTGCLILITLLFMAVNRKKK